VSVEQIRDKSKVELGVSGYKRCRCQELAAFEPVGILEDLLSALMKIAGLKRTTRADFGGELIEQNCVVFSILYIG
jgi:hypothetical protein